MTTRTTRSGRVTATREVILSTAERLFAEHGVYAVSNRQISEAAGQGNTAAVGYHFGTKADLVRAIIRKHTVEIDRIRDRIIAEMGDSDDPRDWVACMVRPTTEHLATLGNPTWFARFGAQIMTDPALRGVMAEESMSSPSLVRTVEGLKRCLPQLPPEVRAERNDMTRQLMVHMNAERERLLADGLPTARTTWQDAAAGLVDAIVGLWRAPVTGS
ncbi:TetR/AcrR family transcriptional regulator [Amycolatopsis endophytica]|uniref:AcrR family transcriptional regulator n=1 Tax=Amycolatopsis endophytica TaxID=860233 RepID=A0A853BDG1_9PSEU|nr:TetR family transcriptional regulator [Amycolatopsis endophytica]NYI93279.1 AcrR family transcriptional regulator [Amycolatopsis endophytica]